MIQQDGNKGIASVTYKNCMSAEGLGGIGDFLEKTLRQKNSNTTKNNSVDFKGQDGAIVLILCLDGMSEKAIIVGSMTHPDRKTKLTDTGPRLEGEFNGVHIKVDKDGSTSLQFKGATDSKGTPTDSSQGTTTVKIEKDGSFQVDHTGVTFRMEKGGTASITAKKDITLNAQGNINIVAKGDVNVQCTNAKVNASAQVDVKSPKIKLNGTSSGITTANSHQGVVDFITGVPVQPSETTTGDV
ncbi:MAG: hypothetical protein OIN85_00850 [Candidatus Methanoperedens sp.]|nr:hypothetical protein [Candidatus Methanoperedens sp.]